MATIKVDGTHGSMEMERIRSDELGGPKTYTSRDHDALTRTGKKPVLKVP